MPIHHLETGDVPVDGFRHGGIFASHLSPKSSKGRQFRISLPNEEDDDTDVQREGPRSFSKYRAQSRESAGSSEFSSLSASGVQTDQNVFNDSHEDELNGDQPQKRENRLIQSIKNRACKPNEKLIPGAAFLHVQ